MKIEDMEIIEEHTAKKRGRPQKNAIAMTPAERKAASRSNRKQKEQNAERQDLIAALVRKADFGEGVEKKWYLENLMELSIAELREHKDLIAALMEIYSSTQAHVISNVRKAEEYRRIARQQERQHLRGLAGLSIEDLRLALKGVNGLPDTRGRSAKERMSGNTGMPEIERIAAARERSMHGRRIKPAGAGPDS
jgi:hypothetical protein